MTSFYGIGLMSGNSLDGLDICFSEFLGNPNVDVWSYRMIKTVTIPYTDKMTEKLKGVARLSGRDLILLHHEYGRFVGKTTTEFMEREDIKADFVASTGHSAFHQPESGLTFCLGDGETIAAYLPCPIVTNFENKDVELGGQGRPLMALGDLYLFSNFDFCLNLGGIAFVSCNGQAFDICPCNVVLNYLAKLDDCNLQYDVDGRIAAGGTVIPSLLERLNELPYYFHSMPKTLSREWFDEQMVPLLDSKQYSIADMMRTCVEHVTDQITTALSQFPKSSPPSSPKCGPRKILVTGGGAMNQFLMDLLAEKLDELGIIVAECDKDLIEYKEALITAFLGLKDYMYGLRSRLGESLPV